ncbi:hypothetical protein HZH66_013393 [Vespula vulgaris]|uniref:Uncharacterized protein n=1 Tax=Vespula vulgaris TaxID=7454 RepID=A0A834J8G0_VESVU|nr:hypothetical protein HZH66_013393 [Vespula vulgaris]
MDRLRAKELKICGGISSGGEVCCSADMELRLQARARDKHEKATRDTLQRLHQLLSTRGNRFHIRNPQYASHNKEIPRSEGVGDDTGTHDPRRRLKGQRGEVKVVVGVGLEIGIGKRGWGQDLRIRETGKKLPMSNEQERKEDSLLFARHLRRTSTNEEAPGDPRELMKSILPADSF